MGWREQGHTVWARLRGAWARRRWEVEMKAEMEAHVLHEMDRNLEAGMSPEEAERAARRRFGHVDRHQEAARDRRGGLWLEQAAQDVRYALRQLWKERGFTVVAVSTLALAIGVNTAMFTLFNAFALRPLPVESPEELVVMSSDLERRSGGFSYREFEAYVDGNTVLDGLAAWTGRQATWSEPESAIAAGAEADGDSLGAEPVLMEWVSGNYLEVLGGRMALGRWWNGADDPVASPEAVIVLNHRFWQRRFQGDPEILGRQVRLNQQTFVVIGVTAEGFIGTNATSPVGWAPLATLDHIAGGPAWREDVAQRWLRLFGRLRPGISRDSARAELNLIAGRWAADHPDTGAPERIAVLAGDTLVPLEGNVVQTAVMMAPLLISFVLVLLIAAANVTNLLLARAASRRAEIAMRLALGASRGRLIRQLFTESLVLSLVGGAAGLALSVWAVDVLNPVVMAELPPVVRESFAINLNPDLRILAFCFSVALATGLVAGTVPAWQTTQRGLQDALQRGGGGVGRGGRPSRWLDALVVVQLAVCLVLLTVAGKLMRNFDRLSSLDVGIDAERVLVADAPFRPEPTLAGHRALVERVSGLPSVERVALEWSETWASRPRRTAVHAAGTAANAEDSRMVAYNIVGGDLFGALGIPIRAGRGFSAHDEEGEPVVVISETLAARLFPGESAVDRFVELAPGSSVGKPQREAAVAAFERWRVIGVAGDAMHGHAFDPDAAYLYLPQRSVLPQRRFALLVRATGDITPAGREVFDAVTGSGEWGEVPPTMTRMTDSLREQLAGVRMAAGLASILGGVALVMALVGLYGMVAFFVSQRVREIGVRMALGAEGRVVVAFFLRRGLKLVMLGLVPGVAGGILLGRFMGTALVGDGSMDPVSLMIVPLALATVAALACWIPARRATRVDPVVALRAE